MLITRGNKKISLDIFAGIGGYTLSSAIKAFFTYSIAFVYAL